MKSIPDFGKAIDNRMVQRLIGIYSMKGKVTAETIPSKAKDRSMFSCERYQFFLDASFEISSECCKIMKKEPMNRYAKESRRVPITGQMASESRLRTQVWLNHGCNAFDSKKQMSNPMSFWTEQDVLLYIYKHGKEMVAKKLQMFKENNPTRDLEAEAERCSEWERAICSVYGEIVKENEVEGQLDFEDLGLFELERPTLKTTGCKRTGCVLCGYGAHREKAKEGRFEQLKQTHPNMYKALDKAKNSGVTMREAIDWTNEHGGLKIRY